LITLRWLPACRHHRQRRHRGSGDRRRL